MRNPNGYVQITDGHPRFGGKVVGELDTFQCSHCGKHSYVKAGAKLDELGNMCRGCMKMICPECAKRTTTIVYGMEIQGCVTWERNMEIQESRDRLYRAARGG